MPNNSNDLIRDLAMELGQETNVNESAGGWQAYRNSPNLTDDVREAYTRQMRAYMSAMQLLPPVTPRAETPAEMQRGRESAFMATVRQRHEQIERENELRRGEMHNLVPALQPPRLEPVYHPEFEVNFDVAPVPALRMDAWRNWVGGGISDIKKETIIPEAEKMNYVASIIHTEFENRVVSERGTNAWMAYNTIIKERLVKTEPDDAKTLTGEVNYTRNGKREKMRLGRYIRRHIFKESVLSEKACQASIEKLTDFFFPTVEFHVDSGPKIMQNYDSCIGGGSCMAGSDSNKVAMYADNPKCFSQLIGKQNRNTARAILFHCDDGYTLLGRIYCGSSYLTRMMEEHAKEKGWMIYDGYDIFIKGEEINRSEYDLKISGVEWHEGGVPYMDDFENASVEDDGTLTLYWQNGGDYTLTDTCGFLRDGCWCCCCDGAFGTQDMAYSDISGWWCPNCYEEHFASCEDCDTTVSLDSGHHACDRFVCSGCYDDNYIVCQECSDLVERDDCTTVNDEEICDHCLTTKYTKCGECDEYVQVTITGENGIELCEDCKELEYVETE